MFELYDPRAITALTYGRLSECHLDIFQDASDEHSGSWQFELTAQDTQKGQEIFLVGTMGGNKKEAWINLLVSAWNWFYAR